MVVSGRFRGIGVSGEGRVRSGASRDEIQELKEVLKEH